MTILAITPPAIVYLEQQWRHAVLAEPHYDVGYEKRSPTQEEDAHDDPDGDGGLVLLQKGGVRVLLRRGAGRGRGLGAVEAVSQLPPPLPVAAVVAADGGGTVTHGLASVVGDDTRGRGADGLLLGVHHKALEYEMSVVVEEG